MFVPLRISFLSHALNIPSKSCIFVKNPINHSSMRVLIADFCFSIFVTIGYFDACSIHSSVTGTEPQGSAIVISLIVSWFSGFQGINHVLIPGYNGSVPSSPSPTTCILFAKSGLLVVISFFILSHCKRVLSFIVVKKRFLKICESGLNAFSSILSQPKVALE
jgi:hypothetical protein